VYANPSALRTRVGSVTSFIAAVRMPSRTDAQQGSPPADPRELSAPRNTTGR